MKLGLGLAIGMSLTGAAALAGQNAVDMPDAHVALARAAAGDTYQNLFNFLCAVPAQRGAAQPGGGPQGCGPSRGGPSDGGRASGPPPRSTWYAEPVKVFDNLYFVGQSEYSAWAVTTSEGIILIDTLFQDRYRTRVLMSAADWDVIDRVAGTKPARDSGVSAVATDGQTLVPG